MLRPAVWLCRAQRLEHARDRADVRRDAHAVVVQDDDHARPHVTDAVHGLEGHARCQRAVADDRDHMVFVAAQIARDGHALRGGDGSPRVARAELIVLGLAAREEPGDAAVLAKRVEAATPAGEHLVHVGLMPRVPHQLVARRVEHAMKGDGELHRAQAR
jgi:hypothetical protein